MAFSYLQLKRLFILVSLSMLSVATDDGHEGYDGDFSPGIHDAFNRTVVLNSESEHFLAMIFHDYSDNATKKISAARFKDLLRDLNLGEVSVTKTSSEPSQESSESRHRQSRSYEQQAGEFGEFARKLSGQRSRQKRRSSTEQSEQEVKPQLNFLSHGGPARARERKRRDMEDNQYYLDDHNECLEEHELLSIHDVRETEGLSQDDFVRICPSLIRQLQKGSCIEEKPESSDAGEDSGKMLHVWGYGILSITVISLTSLLAIAIIPLMGHSIYKKIMSFLVALAVGTLSGDALLHLIPHAFNSGHNDSEGHTMNIYKSCVIMAGIYVFFMVECTMKARMARKKRSQEEVDMCDDVTSPDKMSLSQRKKEAANYKEMVGSRLAGIQRCNSCDGPHFPKVTSPFSEGCKPASCELALVESGKEERASTRSESSQEKEPLWKPSCHGNHGKERDDRSKHSFSDSELVAVLQGKSCIRPNIYSNNNFSASGSNSSSQTRHNANQIRPHEGNRYSCPVPAEMITITTETTITNDNGDGDCEDENEHDHHHHHHHHHSHKIDKATSIASVAWMVIVGDGFHNFSDGLAVGAAFSASLTSGLTTAIAVFCHELPHELGDFAILLRSGLTFKQALAYNLASAIISYIGLVLGIIIGDIHSAHTWVLALTAGMFLYISLVDMLPELSNYLNEGGGWSVVLSQNLGILSGVFIMLVIALYES